MSKKSRNKNAKKVLSSFAELGNTGKNTLSRLATTVKADMPTMILGNKDPFAGTVKTDSIKLKSENRVSKIAKRLIPFRAAQSPVQNKPAAARLKHIAGKMGKAAVPKTRKSKGMIWLFVFFTALTGGSYYAWQSIDGIGAKIAQVIDYKTWLNTTAGKVKPVDTTTASSEINIGSRNNSTSTTTTNTIYSGSKNSQTFAATKSATIKTKTLDIKKSSKPVVAKKSSKAIATKKATSPAKTKQWEAKLAKLKKKSQADYRKASLNYRQKQK